MDPRFSLALLPSSNYPLTLWVNTDTIWVENPKNCCSIPGFCFLFGDSLFCYNKKVVWLQNQTHEYSGCRHYFRTKRKGKKKEEKKGGLCKIKLSRNERITFLSKNSVS